jgi:glycosyltransferase involved in cell wall biosynthesis
MRVLQLGPYPPPHGGVQTNLVAIRRFLLKRQIPCAVINLTRFRKPEADEVYYPRTWIGLLRLLLRLRYDLIHLHIGGHLTRRLLALSLICCLIPGVRTVLTFHSGGYPSSRAGRTARRWTLRGFILRRFDRLIGVSPGIIDLFHRFGIPSRRTRLIHPHALTDEPSGDALPEPAQNFLRSHRPVLVTVGLLEPEYELPLQIEVLGPIRERYPDAGLVIVGAGSLEEELRGQIKATPYREHVLLCGDVAHTVALRLIAEGDVFLRTTRYDGDSIAVREALHLGVPVIATDNGMRPEGVDLIRHSDLMELRRAIGDRLAHAGSRRRRGDGDERNLEAVLELYTEITT